MPETTTKYTVIKKSSNGNALYLQEEGSDKPSWFYLTDKVTKYAQKLSEGSKITINAQKKDDKNYISFFQFAEGRPTSNYKKPYTSSASSNARPAGGSSWGQRDPETQDSIVRQSVMKAASELVSSLTFKNVEDALEAWDTAYQHMHNKISGKADTTGLVEVDTPDNDEPEV